MIVVTIPVFNEKKNLRKCVEILLEETAALTKDFCVIIAEDGSIDGTEIVAKQVESQYSEVKYIHSRKKLGRGLALKNAWKRIEGDVYLFVDADLATDMKYYPKLIKFIENGYDLATGSRYIKGAKVNRPPLRNFVSKIYNLLIRMTFKDEVFDHQIGFKAFSKRLITQELNNCKSDSWFWDTEIIVRSVRRNYKFIEFPVEWTEKKRKRTPLKRLLSDIVIHGLGLISLKRNLNCSLAPIE